MRRDEKGRKGEGGRNGDVVKITGGREKEVRKAAISKLLRLPTKWKENLSLEQGINAPRTFEVVAGGCLCRFEIGGRKCVREHSRGRR